jgi:Calcineurin-like phosphoesterase
LHTALPNTPLDIIGDIHGEHDALRAVLAGLGYDEAGLHPQGRSLVFVGDLCDRGPDSPGVVARVRRLVEAGRAVELLGSHAFEEDLTSYRLVFPERPG